MYSSTCKRRKERKSFVTYTDRESLHFHCTSRLGRAFCDTVTPDESHLLVLMNTYIHKGFETKTKYVFYPGREGSKREYVMLVGVQVEKGKKKKKNKKKKALK